MKANFTQNSVLPDSLAQELAANIRTESDLSSLMQKLMKQVIETSLKAELSHHLETGKAQLEAKPNSRNGYMAKSLKSEMGQIHIQTPRDRTGSFEPILVPKNKTRISAIDQHIITLYAKGMSTRDIAHTLQELYGADVSHSLISQVTQAVMADVIAWQARPLEALYPIVYLDCIVVKCHQDNRVINKAVYIALGIDLEGKKDCLGLWISENEGAKFWHAVVGELKTRGVQDIFYACVDGLKGFDQAIEAVFPKARVQRCMVHLVRSSMRFVVHKDMKMVAADLKKIYHAHTLAEAEQCLLDFQEKWDSKYKQVGRIWQDNWLSIQGLFECTPEVRKVIYTTNAIESLNSVIRKAISQRKIFPSDDSVFKVVYLAIMQASKNWTMAVRDWKAALQSFAITFEGRMPPL